MKFSILFNFISVISAFQGQGQRKQRAFLNEQDVDVDMVGLEEAPFELELEALAEDKDENLQSIFISSATKTTTLATGKLQEWNVYEHPAFPRYALRTKTTSKLCDPNVYQVCYQAVDLADGGP